MPRKKPSPELDPLAAVVIVAIVVAFFIPWQITAAALIVVALVALAYVLNFRRSQHLLHLTGILEVDKMSGVEFEQRLRVLFSDKGYKVEMTAPTADMGADLVLVKDGVRTVVQAKRYGRPVGEEAIQQVNAARGMYECDHAIAVTNNSFTRLAKIVAQKLKIELWERERLIKEMRETQGLPIR